MSLAFSRRSFLKYSAVAAVAVAGAGLFSGCDQTDTKNLYCDGAGSITVLQINAVLVPTMTMPRSTRILT